VERLGAWSQSQLFDSLTRRSQTKVGFLMATTDSVTPVSNDALEAARIRMTLDLSRRLNSEVERLAHTNGTSKADVLRFAVELLTAATAAKQAGMHVGAWTERPDGNRWEREFIGL
jgi:hypothetical protein